MTLSSASSNDFDISDFTHSKINRSRESSRDEILMNRSIEEAIENAIRKSLEEEEEEEEEQTFVK